MSLNNKSESEEFALVPWPPNAVEKAEPGTKRILSGMVADTLALVNKEQAVATEPRFRIGEYEWCEPDYRQFLIWAKAVGLNPDDVVSRLLNPEHPSLNAKERFFKLNPEARILKAILCIGDPLDEPLDKALVADGRLMKVGWDFFLLKCSNIEWVEGLKVTHVRFIDDRWSSRDIGTLPLPELAWLSVRGAGLTAVNLSKVPKLRELDCSHNRLTNVALDFVPVLTKLDCGGNRLAILTLSSVPVLSDLYCGGNELANLALDLVPTLTNLDCSHNRLTNLTLDSLSALTNLACDCNRLTALDLSGLQQLVDASCASNELVELSLQNLSSLSTLTCWGNQIRKLDLSQTPELEELVCFENQIVKLDTSRCSKLSSLDCHDNQIVELDLTVCRKLRYLDCSKNRIKTLDVRNLDHLETLIYDHETAKLLKRSNQDF